MERITIIVEARDKFSPTSQCLETLINNTPQPYDLIVVMGGASTDLKVEWLEKFGAKNTIFLFRSEFLNQGKARNIGLSFTKTRLAVLMDNDNFVRPGWLESLIKCQKETGAVMVVPLILETPRKIHTAGNDLYITHFEDKAYGHKNLRFHNMPLDEGSNLKRCRTDYAEMHCMLVQVEPTVRLGAFDENLLEMHECDSGLTWAKGGYEMWFEPTSVVLYDHFRQMSAGDIRLFAWRWDLRAVQDSYRLFHKKWNIDISEHGTFRDWLLRHNDNLGLLPRRFPSELALRVDRWMGRARHQLLEISRIPQYRLREYKKRKWGYHDWTVGLETKISSNGNVK